jgi:MSHA biogenesis protein MshK
MVDLVRIVQLLFAVSLAAVAFAQPLPDPTRPPAGVAGSGDIGGEASTTGVRQLNSIILRPGSKPRALIGGEWVELGQKMGDAKVVKISVNRVELRGPQGREVLLLHPDVEWRPSASGSRSKGNQGVQP